MTRPAGVTVLAGLQFFYSGFSLLSSLAILLVKPFRETLIQTSMEILANDPQVQASPVPIEAIVQGSIMFGAIVGILFSLVGILLGYGLLKLKRWAWICTLVLQSIAVLGGLRGLFVVVGAGALPAITIGQQLFQLLVSGVIVFYLLQRDVRQSFGDRANRPL